MIKDNGLMVQVECLTYNHSSYIIDAMNGFCMQQTDFPFVCTIIDDASSDGEPRIIKKFLEDNFDLNDQSVFCYEDTSDYTLFFAQNIANRNCFFAVYFLKYNHYQIKKPTESYFNRWRGAAKYIALCEGDDWWTDSKKLKKQVDYMETHPDTVLCFHNAIAHWEDGRKSDELFSRIDNRFYDYNEVFLFFIVPTASILHRAYVLDTDLYVKVFTNPKRFIGDWPLLLVCAANGKLWGMSDCMSVYRRTLTGFTLSEGSKTISYDLRAAEMNYEFYKIFPRPYCAPCRFKTINYLFGAYSASKHTDNVRYDAIWKAFKLFPIHTLLYIFGIFWDKMLGKKRPY